MGDPAPTTDRMHRHKHRHEPHKQNTRAISHQPLPIGRKPPHTCPPAKDPAKIRIRETTIRSLNCTVDRTVFFFSQTYDALKRSLQSTAVIFLPATLPPKERERKKKGLVLQFRSHADGLTCLEHPYISVATSGPAQSFPTLLHQRQEDPFRPWPRMTIHSRTSACSTTASPCVAADVRTKPFGNISWCAHRCDIRINTSSTENGLAAAHSPLLRRPHARHMQQKQAACLHVSGHDFHCASHALAQPASDLVEVPVIGDCTAQVDHCRRYTFTSW